MATYGLTFMVEGEYHMDYGEWNESTAWHPFETDDIWHQKTITLWMCNPVREFTDKHRQGLIDRAQVFFRELIDQQRWEGFVADLWICGPSAIGDTKVFNWNLP